MSALQQWAILPIILAAFTQPSMAASVKIANHGADIGITAFKDVCLASAPSFASATKKAKRFGVTDFLDLGDSRDGMSADKSISVQIKPNKECAITTESRSDQTLGRQFLAAIATVGKGVPEDDKGGPFTATIKGQAYRFFHDRKGGEAYVMLQLGN